MRRRARVRQKTQAVDTTTVLDLSDHEPTLAPRTRAGRRLWDQIVASPPYWWDPADVLMAEHLCTAKDAVAIAMRPGAATEAGRAAVMKEYRMTLAELGLSPTSRGRLRLTEAQGVAAARKVQQLRDDEDEDDTPGVIDIDELVP